LPAERFLVPAQLFKACLHATKIKSWVVLDRQRDTRYDWQAIWYWSLKRTVHGQRFPNDVYSIRENSKQRSAAFHTMNDDRYTS